MGSSTFFTDQTSNFKNSQFGKKMNTLTGIFLVAFQLIIHSKISFGTPMSNEPKEQLLSNKLHIPTSSNPMEHHATPNPSPIKETDKSVSIFDRTLYEDLMMFGRIYTPNLVEIIEVLQTQDLWENAKNLVYKFFALLMGFKIPVINVEVTRTQTEGIILDALQVYKKWQSAT